MSAARHKVPNVSDASKEQGASSPAASPARLGVPRDLAPLHAALSELIARADGLAPEDTAILTKLWPAGFSKPLGTLSSDIERLVHLGLVRRVFIGNEDGYLTILPASKDLSTMKPVEINMQAPAYSSPIAANKTLYIATHSHLFAFAAGEPE